MDKHKIYTEIRDLHYFTSKSFKCYKCDFRSSDYNKAIQHATTENYNDAVDECVYPDVKGNYV